MRESLPTCEVVADGRPRSGGIHVRRTGNEPNREETAPSREDRTVTETKEGTGTDRGDDTAPSDAAGRGPTRAPDGHGGTPVDAPARDPEWLTRLDSALYLLSHHRRREALWYLRSAERPVPVDELVDHLTELARRESPTTRPDAVALDVVHTHLPRLERSPAVEPDDGGERLRYVGEDVIDRLLDAVGSIEGRHQCDDE